MLGSLLLDRIFKLSWPKAIYAVTCIFFLSGTVEYTPDWEGYSNWISNDSGRDLIFQYISAVYKDYGQEYSAIHMTYVLLHSALLVYLASRLTKGYFLVLFFFLSITYLFYTTQIRFFLAYFSFCLGLYMGAVEKKNNLSIALYLFAFLNHSAVILIVPFIFALRLQPKRLALYIATLAIASFLVISLPNIVSFLPDTSSYFSDYLASDVDRPGILGSLSIFGPYLASSVLLHRLSQRLYRNGDSTAHTLHYQYVWYMTVLPMAYLPVAMGLQIVGHRIIVSSLIFHFSAWMILFRNGFKFTRASATTVMLGIWLFFLVSTYAIPYVFGMTSYFDSSLKVFKSNLLFQD